MSFAKDQLLPGESLVLLTRQHALVLIRPIVLNLVSLAVLAGICMALRDYYWIMLFCLAPLAYLFWELWARQRKEYIVTDRRIVKQEGVFSITSFDAPLDKINNIFHEQTLFGRIFKYGDVGLETASEQGTTVFRFIPNPVMFKNCVVRQREAYKAAPAGISSAPSRQDIPRLLENLASLRDRNIISPAEFEAKKKSLLDQL